MDPPVPPARMPTHLWTNSACDPKRPPMYTVVRFSAALIAYKVVSMVIVLVAIRQLYPLL